MYDKPGRPLPVFRKLTWGDDAYEIKSREHRDVFDTIVLTDGLGELLGSQDREIELPVRLLSPENRRLKYCTRLVKARISADPAKYKGILQVRFQRGLLHPAHWSIEVISEEEGLLQVSSGAALS